MRVPVTRLGEIAEVVGLAVRRGTFHEVFKKVSSRVPEAIPAIIGGGEEVREKILVKPNSWVIATENEYLDTASKYLVPDRIWIDTAHATALYSEEPVVASIFFGLKPRHRSIGEEHLKAIILWLNTSWGLLTILSERTETRGRWIEITKTKWRTLPVLDVTSLSRSTIESLAGLLDKYADKTLRRIPMQFNPRDPDPVRWGIDLDFIETIAPSLSHGVVARELQQLYKRIHEALSAWIEGLENTKQKEQ